MSLESRGGLLLVLTIIMGIIALMGIGGGIYVLLFNPENPELVEPPTVSEQIGEYAGEMAGEKAKQVVKSKVKKTVTTTIDKAKEKAAGILIRSKGDEEE